MKIKQQLEDFRVRELLLPDFLVESGPWRVYRVSKRKLTSMQAAQVLAHAAGASAGDVRMAGLKDRQGITVQYMALRAGREVRLREKDLRIENVGFARSELSSSASAGNAFEIIVRGLSAEELDTLRTSLPVVRESGLIHYFDDQRFGNLRYGQGWIALDLIHGKHEKALRRLLTAGSGADDERNESFKSALDRNWGDWTACREIAGKFREHHSVFTYLKSHRDDFRGAFFHVSSRLRLIHLYAFQSHIWNRAVCAYVRRITKPDERLELLSAEGPLVFPKGPFVPEAGMQTFRLPGPRLEDVQHPLQRELLEEALATERLVADQFHIEGVSGFQLKGEDRPLLVRASHMRVRPPEPDSLNRGLRSVRLRFELPRGAYATLVVRRLLARPWEGVAREESRGVPPHRARSAAPKKRAPAAKPSERGHERSRPRRPRDPQRASKSAK